MLSIAGHKFYGPKGTGALWIKRGVRLVPPMTGGTAGAQSPRRHRERSGARGARRRARAWHARSWPAKATAPGALRDRLEAGHARGRPGQRAQRRRSPRVPNTTNLSIERVESESLLIGLDLAGIAVSSGSACSSGTLEPSHVLKAMGLSHGRTLGSIRFSLGASNTDADIDRVIEVLPPLVEKLRSLTTVGGTKVTEDTRNGVIIRAMLSCPRDLVIP